MFSGATKGLGVDVLNMIARHAAERPGNVVHRWRSESLTFSELHAWSDAIAAHLSGLGLERGAPIAVYGHKQSMMLVCFAACVKAGHPYIPIDSSLPGQRVRTILDSAQAPLVLAVEPLDAGIATMQLSEMEAVRTSGERVDATLAVREDEPYYIIYTSGSTGTPKGVQISRRAVNRFVEWALTLLPQADEQIVLNQAPFSFDLSVYEVMMCQAAAMTMVSLDKEHVARFRELFDELRSSGATVWVSTPSFADLCLASDEFNAILLPKLRCFLFCGETLSNETAVRLRQRFPAAIVVNTYGPTESTVAVTAVECDNELLARFPVLPVGAVKPGTHIQIWRPDGSLADDGETGEIVIAGDTVSIGYYRRPDLTESAFTKVDTPDGPQRAYRTGDAGYLDEGFLHFVGRLDFQVKLHGYRIEIEDIEANLRRLDGVQQAVVLPVMKDSAVTHLYAAVQLREGTPDQPLRRTTELKRALKELLPDYMVPKVFGYVDAIPLTTNGKADRAALRLAKL